MVVVKTGRLIDGTGTPPQSDVALLIEHGRITRIVPAASVEAAGDQVVDFSSATVAPGFIDAHCHLMFEPGPDHDAVRATLEGDDEHQGMLRAARNAQRALAAGITTLRDCGGRGLTTLALRDAVNRGLVSGPRIIASGPAITTTRGHLYYLGMEADTADELLKAGRRVLKAGADYVKVCVTGGNMTAGSNPFLPQYDTRALSALVADAHRLGKPVAGHAHGAEGIRVAVEAGIDFIEHCTWAAPDGKTDYDGKTVDRMLSKGLWADITFTGVQRRLLPAALADEGEMARFRSSLAVFPRMIADGIPCMVSSDNGVRNTRFDDFALTIQVAIAGCGLSVMAALAAVTREPARALGLERDLGTLEAGKIADLIVLDGDPLVDPGALGRVVATMRDGRIVASQGMLAMPQPAG